MTTQTAAALHRRAAAFRRPANARIGQLHLRSRSRPEAFDASRSSRPTTDRAPETAALAGRAIKALWRNGPLTELPSLTELAAGHLRRPARAFIASSTASGHQTTSGFGAASATDGCVDRRRSVKDWQKRASAGLGLSSRRSTLNSSSSCRLLPRKLYRHETVLTCDRASRALSVETLIWLPAVSRAVPTFRYGASSC